MSEPDHMEIGQKVVLDNGERMYIWDVQFLPVPGLNIGLDRKMWFLTVDWNTAVVWLPEYGAWRICGAKLYPVFNEAAVRRQVGLR